MLLISIGFVFYFYAGLDKGLKTLLDQYNNASLAYTLGWVVLALISKVIYLHIYFIVINQI